MIYIGLFQKKSKQKGEGEVRISEKNTCFFETPEYFMSQPPFWIFSGIANWTCSARLFQKKSKRRVEDVDFSGVLKN